MNSMLSRVRAAAEQMVTSPEPAHARTAIIDIGSNSVRLVIYDGPRRIPFILFNEKVMAGLGHGKPRKAKAILVEFSCARLQRYSCIVNFRFKKLGRQV